MPAEGWQNKANTAANLSKVTSSRKPGRVASPRRRLQPGRPLFFERSKSLFDNHFPGFAAEEERFERLLNLVNSHPTGDNLIEIGTVLLQALQIGWQFVIP